MNSALHLFSNKKVLVVEDNKVNQLLVKNLLKKFGFAHIDTADDGNDALTKVNAASYDLILMDIQMPGMDGYQTTSAIRAGSNLSMRSVPVIALTGDASEKEKAKAAESGMNDYVVKPYAPEELLRVLTKAMGGANAVPSAGIDPSVLEKFTGGDKALTIQIIEIFLQQVPEAVISLERLVPEKNWPEVYAITHKIKSSFAVFGMEDLRTCVLAMEEYARDEMHLEKMPELFTKFKVDAGNAIISLKRELESLRN